MAEQGPPGQIQYKKCTSNRTKERFPDYDIASCLDVQVWDQERYGSVRA